MPFNRPTFESAVANFVGEYRNTHIVVGRSLQPWYRRWFNLSALDRLLSSVPMVDITVVDVRDT